MNPALVPSGEGVMPTVIVHKLVGAELDEMWSFVGRKREQRWLWGALGHQTGRIVAYVFGRREDRAFLALKMLLAPFTLRTRIKRLVRKTICFSKSAVMHEIVIGLFINRFAFGLAV